MTRSFVHGVKRRRQRRVGQGPQMSGRVVPIKRPCPQQVDQQRFEQPLRDRGEAGPAPSALHEAQRCFSRCGQAIASGVQMDAIRQLLQQRRCPGTVKGKDAAKQLHFVRWLTGLNIHRRVDAVF